MIKSIIEKCKVLRLKAFAENLSDVIQMAAQKNQPSISLTSASIFPGKNRKNRILNLMTMDLINHLIAAEADHSPLKKLQDDQTPTLLVCDEIGYLPPGTQGSNLFFQVISARHEKSLRS
ncbi:MAG: ATP-binding protein [Syntrophobacterales bacterium]|nr:ATP-binding protein [Syntrophobacterales bacterium]